jgi:hypothetical protein
VLCSAIQYGCFVSEKCVSISTLLTMTRNYPNAAVLLDSCPANHGSFVCCILPPHFISPYAPPPPPSPSVFVSLPSHNSSAPLTRPIHPPHLLTRPTVPTNLIDQLTHSTQTPTHPPPTTHPTHTIQPTHIPNPLTRPKYPVNATIQYNRDASIYSSWSYLTMKSFSCRRGAAVYV